MRFFGALIVGLMVAATPTPAATAGQRPDNSTLSTIYPKPQSVTPRHDLVVLPQAVTLVAGAHTDASALSATKAALVAAGVGEIRQVGDTVVVRDSPLTVYVGGAIENRATGTALSGFGVQDTNGLPSGGYVLAVGANQIILDGVDATGTFYAAQTLRQLIHSGQRVLPGVAIRDWPALPIRGVIEGFYGTPWSNSDRLAQLDFYGQHKMNTYVYSPKDDPYLRASWREEYPADKLAELKGLVSRAVADHVEFTYALSPGLSVCYSDPNDTKALVAKFQSLWDIGVRTFAVPLDDISYTKWNCDADLARFGTGGAAAGAAQSFLLNAVQTQFIATHPGASKLEMVPTEYSDLAASPYKTTLAAQLDPAVLVEWTGVGVIASTITDAQATSARQVYGHAILVWDNYPVNDYIAGQLLLGPYVGRSPGLASELAGITANPMIEAAASKPALFTVADYTWNPQGYDPKTSWNAGLAELAGGNGRLLAALSTFADVNYTSPLDRRQAPVLSAEIAAFWSAWSAGDFEQTQKLRAVFEQLRTAPAVLRVGLPDKDFITETKLWLDATQAWATAAEKAVDMLQAQNDGDGARAWTNRQALGGLVRTAQSFNYVALDGTSHQVQVGATVIDTFITKALAENTKWFAVPRVSAAAQTSLSTYLSYVPANMVDGDRNTFYWSARAVQAGDSIGVDLGTVRPVADIDVLMSKSDSADDYIHNGVVEYSLDGRTWTTGQSFANNPEVVVTPPAGTAARYVRLRATAGQTNWLVVRDFTVSSDTVSGGPDAVAGSRLAAVVDGNVDNAYVAARAPQLNETLTITLPTTRSLSSVVVLQSAGQGGMQVHVDGQWRTVGMLSGGYSRFQPQGAVADAVRIAWAPGSPAPVVDEVAIS